MEAKLDILLVGNISNCPWKIEVAVYSALNVDGGASFVDPLSLPLKSWLVIDGQWNGSTVLGHYAFWITCICTDDSTSNDECHVCGTSLAFHGLSWKLVLFDLVQSALVSVELEGSLDWRDLIGVLLTDGNHLIDPLGCHYLSVKTKESVLKGLWDIFSGLVVCLLFEFALEVSLTELSALNSTVSIEYSKQSYVFIILWIDNVCIFLKTRMSLKHKVQIAFRHHWNSLSAKRLGYLALYLPCWVSILAWPNSRTYRELRDLCQQTDLR